MASVGTWDGGWKYFEKGKARSSCAWLQNLAISLMEKWSNGFQMEEILLFPQMEIVNFFF